MQMSQMGDLCWNLENKILKWRNSQHKNCVWKLKKNPTFYVEKLSIQGAFCAHVCVHNRLYPSQAQNTSGSSNSTHFQCSWSR